MKGRGAFVNTSMFWRRLFLRSFPCSKTKERLSLFHRKLVLVGIQRRSVVILHKLCYLQKTYIHIQLCWSTLAWTSANCVEMNDQQILMSIAVHVYGPNQLHDFNKYTKITTVFSHLKTEDSSSVFLLLTPGRHKSTHDRVST